MIQRPQQILLACSLALSACLPGPVPPTGTDAGEDAGPVQTDGGGVDEAAGITQTRETIQLLADTFRVFFRAELRWPLRNSFWNPWSEAVAPAAFSSEDTALFQLPLGMRDCHQAGRGPCWSGPFSEGDSLADPAWLDAWGRPLRYAFIPAHTGLDPSQRFPATIALWSVGPDGEDQIGCTTANAGCAFDENRLAEGWSFDGSDDVLLRVQQVDPSETTRRLLKVVAQGMRDFHQDTGLWPYAECGWTSNLDPQLDGMSFNSRSTALLETDCAGLTGLWQGTYLWTDLGSAADAVDGWGNPLLFSYLRPDDGWGGGIPGFHDGAVVLWSAGANGIDETACSTGACAVDGYLLARGHSSGTEADDLVLVVDESGLPLEESASAPAFSCATGSVCTTGSEQLLDIAGFPVGAVNPYDTTQRDDVATEAAQTFQVIDRGHPLSIEVVARLLKDFGPSADTSLLVDLVDIGTTSQAPTVPSGVCSERPSSIASGRFDTGALSLGVDQQISIRLETTPDVVLIPSRYYAVIFRMEAPGTNRIGLAGTSGYGSGNAASRTLQQIQHDTGTCFNNPPFVSNARDIALAVQLDTVVP